MAGATYTNLEELYTTGYGSTYNIESLQQLMYPNDDYLSVEARVLYYDVNRKSYVKLTPEKIIRLEVLRDYALSKCEELKLTILLGAGDVYYDLLPRKNSLFVELLTMNLDGCRYTLNDTNYLSRVHKCRNTYQGFITNFSKTERYEKNISKADLNRSAIIEVEITMIPVEYFLLRTHEVSLSFNLSKELPIEEVIRATTMVHLNEKKVYFNDKVVGSKDFPIYCDVNPINVDIREFNPKSQKLGEDMDPYLNNEMKKYKLSTWSVGSDNRYGSNVFDFPRDLIEVYNTGYIKDEINTFFQVFYPLTTEVIPDTPGQETHVKKPTLFTYSIFGRLNIIGSDSNIYNQYGMLFKYQYDKNALNTKDNAVKKHVIRCIMPTNPIKEGLTNKSYVFDHVSTVLNIICGSNTKITEPDLSNHFNIPTILEDYDQSNFLNSIPGGFTNLDGSIQADSDSKTIITAEGNTPEELSSLAKTLNKTVIESGENKTLKVSVPKPSDLQIRRRQVNTEDIIKNAASKLYSIDIEWLGGNPDLIYPGAPIEFININNVDKGDVTAITSYIEELKGIDENKASEIKDTNISSIYVGTVTRLYSSYDITRKSIVVRLLCLCQKVGG